jgi:hypothetical protein
VTRWYARAARENDPGAQNASVLRAAVLSTSSPGMAAPFDIAGIAMGVNGLAQDHPNVVRVGSRIYLAWRTEAALGDARAEELWLKLIGWNANTSMIDLSSAEIPLPRWAQHRVGDQRRPALAAGVLSPEGSLVIAIDDLGKVFPGEGNGDPAVQQIPLPLLRLPGDGGI